MPNMIRALVQCGASVTFTRSDKMTVLHSAVASGSVQSVLAALSCGADVNVGWDPVPPSDAAARSRHAIQIRPIHLAANHGLSDIISVLLDAGADIEGKDSIGRTAIMYATANKHNIAAVQTLVERGCDCLVRLSSGTTAVHAAAKTDSQKMVLMLLKEGANVEDDRDSSGATPVDTNPGLFSKKQIYRFLRSDTRALLRYHNKH